MKKIIAFLLCLMMTVAIVPCMAQEVNTVLSGTITCWTWNPQMLETQIEAFNKVYPNIHFEITTSATGSETATKLQTAVAAGTELPDLIMYESNDRYDVISLGILENLEADPYNVDRSKIVDYTLPLNQDAEGHLVGIETTVCPTGLAYQIELAEKYFGTSDPDELEVMFPTWDALLAKGIELKQEYPEIMFFSNDLDLNTLLSGQHVESYEAEDGSLDIESLRISMHYMYEFKKAGLVGDYQQWTTGWYGTFLSDEFVFFTCANWAPAYTVEASDPDAEIQWGLMVPPEGGVTQGGTSLGICVNSQVKDLVWAYINWQCFTQEGADEYKEKVGYFLPLKEYYEDESFFTFHHASFGEQDIGKKLYKDILPNMVARPISKYDTAVSSGFSAFSVLFDTNYADMTEEDAFNLLQSEIEHNIN